MRVALYARYSSENQKDSSITDQHRNCETYAARQDGWSIVKRYADKAISGSTADRPGYQQMLTDARAKHFDVLLVDDFSRLSRDQVETEQARRRLVHWGIRLIGISDGIDTATKGHKMLSSMKGMMNDVFLDDLADKTRRGLVGQVLKGYHVGARSYGYKLVPDYDPLKTDPYGHPARIGTRLAIEPAQARWVRWIFQQYADGLSPLKIVGELNRRKVPPPGRRSTSWCTNALYGLPQAGLGLLNNRLYIGDLTWGRARWVKDPDTKHVQRVACPEREWIRRAAPHLRILTDSVWQQVKARQAEIQRLSPQARTGRGPKYLFSGLLTCGVCGRKFVVIDATRYACSGWKYRGVAVCANTVKAHRTLVERLLLKAIKEDLFSEEGQALFLQETAHQVTVQQRAQKPDHRLRDVEREIANIMTAIKAGILTPTTKRELEKAEAERSTLLAQQSPQAPVITLMPNPLGRFKTVIDNLEFLRPLALEKARNLLRILVGEEIVLHPTSEGKVRYLTAEVSGDYAGMLRLVGGNKSGSGEGQQTSPVRRG